MIPHFCDRNFINDCFQVEISETLPRPSGKMDLTSQISRIALSAILVSTLKLATNDFSSLKSASGSFSGKPPHGLEELGLQDQRQVPQEVCRERFICVNSS